MRVRFNCTIWLLLCLNLAAKILPAGTTGKTAGREMVRKDLTSTVAVVGNEEIAVMQVEELDQILQLQTGVVKGADGNIHIRGGRSSEVAYLVNGVSVTDPFSGNRCLQTI